MGKGSHKGCPYDDGFAGHILHRDEAWTALKPRTIVASFGAVLQFRAVFDC